MEKLTKGEEIYSSISQEIVDLLEQFKQKAMELYELVETIKHRCYEERIGDKDIWLLLNHALENLEINSQQKKKILSPFRPPTPPIWQGEDPAPQKRLSSMESFEGNMEIWCPLTALDPNEIIARQKYMSVGRVMQKGFYIKLSGYNFANMKPDRTDQWVAPESTADETFIS